MKCVQLMPVYHSILVTVARPYTEVLTKSSLGYANRFDSREGTNYELKILNILRKVLYLIYYLIK